MVNDDDSGEQMVPGYVISEVVQKFIIYFHKKICDRNVYEIQIYDEGFNKLTEQYLVKCAWPEAEDISPLVDGGKLH